MRYLRMLVTGGCGFIGSTFCRLMARTDDVEVLNVDCLSYAGFRHNVEDGRGGLDPLRHRLVVADILDEAMMAAVFEAFKPSVVVNFAAETHVDRSISCAKPFVQTNVDGTRVLLDLALKHEVKTFLQISTDEVYGALSASGTPFTEDSPLRPSSPYSASKTAADLLALSYFHTHGLPVIISRCSNNYGPRQYPEKLIPVAIKKLMHMHPIPIYAKGENVRDWIFVDDHCWALHLLIRKGKTGEIYNIGARSEISNLDLIKKLVPIFERSVLGISRVDTNGRVFSGMRNLEACYEFVSDRPGHDFRYAINPSKVEALGWKPETDFDAGLEATVQWYRENLSMVEWNISAKTK